MFALFQWVMDTASLFLFSSSSSSSCFFLVRCLFLCVVRVGKNVFPSSVVVTIYFQ